jgi:uncharacterized heparinase superfamily protein
MLVNIKRFWDSFYVSFIQSGSFYRFSLDKRSGVFSDEKFIMDPWPGDILNGKNILNGKITTEFSTVPFEIEEFLTYKQICLDFRDCAKYANSFFWMRDLQAIGGNSGRKRARKFISIFIENYRKEKRFWQKDPQWNLAVLGERLCSWIFSYSFVVSGASDEFRKNFLSSLCEQYSHLLKSYRIENNPYSKIVILKGLIFCQFVMKNVNLRILRKLIRELKDAIEQSFDQYGMVVSRNPLEQFDLFRSLIEIRFISKNLDLGLLNDFLSNKLSKMASCVRLLRFGDGGLAQFSGDFKSLESFMILTRQLIDTTVSVVDIKTNGTNIATGFDRLATKKSIVIVNTAVSNLKSKFNRFNEPGINIFDFEASFGMDRVIYRSDISMLFDGFRIKANKNSRSFSKKEIKGDGIFFEGEIENNTNNLSFAIRRELFVNANKLQISGTDFVSMREKFVSFIRFVLNEKCNINKVNDKLVLISIGQKQYKLNIIMGQNIKSIIIKDDFTYPSIEIEIENCNFDNIQIKWDIEQMEI